MNLKTSIAAAAIGLLAITAGAAYAQAEAQAESCCCCEDRADRDCCDHGERHGDHGDDHQTAPQQ